MTIKEWEKWTGKMEAMFIKGEPHFHFLQLDLKCDKHHGCKIKHYWKESQAIRHSGTFCHVLHKKDKVVYADQLKDLLTKML